MEPRLDVAVRDELEVRKGTWPAIAVRCEVSYSWLTKFARGSIANPGYQTLRRLAEHLGLNAGRPS